MHGRNSEIGRVSDSVNDVLRGDGVVGDGDADVLRDDGGEIGEGKTSLDFDESGRGVSEIGVESRDVLHAGEIDDDSCWRGRLRLPVRSVASVDRCQSVLSRDDRSRRANVVESGVVGEGDEIDTLGEIVGDQSRVFVVSSRDDE